MNRQQGFTIIEVILFLAVSSGLTAMLLIGVGTAIQRQQYRESVQSYASFLRGQYGRVINVENDRPHVESCPIPVAVDAARGQSDCVILGRYIESTDSDGRQYSARPVYGLFDSVASTWQYGLGSPDTDYTVEWSAKTRFHDQLDGATNIAVLMYRHPDMGNLVVHTDKTKHNPNIGDFFDTTNPVLTDSREICVYDKGWFTNQRMSVSLGARAGSSDSVTVTNSTAGCNDTP